MKKLIVAIALYSLSLAAVCAACSPTKQLAQPLTFSVLYNEREATPFQEDWLILEEYRQQKNVSLDIRTGDDSDYDRVLSQTFASGNIPDIVLKVWPATIEPLAGTGILLPFSDYEHLMPHFQAYIEENQLQEELDRLRLENGKYYILPGFQREIQVQQWAYRRDLFEKHNIKTPRTYDELFDALVTLKAAYPESTPITATWGGAHLFAMMGAGYGIPAGWDGHRMYNPEENRWQFAPATENYHELLRFLNRCYQADILDPEVFSQSDEAYYTKLQDGRGLVTVTWISSGFASWNENLAQNGFPDGEWVPLQVPASTIGITALPPMPRFRKGLVVPFRVIETPYFTDLIQFLDWAVYSETGMTLTNWGVEKITYQQTSEGKVFLPEIKTPQNPQGTLDLTADFGLNTLFNLNENPAFEDTKKPPEIVRFLNDSLEAGETAEAAPALNLSKNAIASANVIDKNLSDHVEATFPKFITGELDIEADWGAYCEQLEKAGYETLEAIWQAAWQAQTQ